MESLDISELRSIADSNFSDYFSYCYHVASLYIADQITLATKVVVDELIWPIDKRYLQYLRLSVKY